MLDFILTYSDMATMIGMAVFTAIIAAVVFFQRRALAHNDRLDFTIRAPAWVGWVGGITMLVFAGIMVLIHVYPTENMEPWYYLVFLGFFALGALLLYYRVRWQLQVLGNTIFYLPLFGPAREIAFQDITTYQLSYVSSELIAFNGKKRLFRISTMAPNIAIMLKRLQNAGVPQR